MNEKAPKWGKESSTNKEKEKPPLNIAEAIARLRNEEVFIGAQKIAQASPEDQQVAAGAFFKEAGDDAVLIEKLSLMLAGTTFIRTLRHLVG